MAAVTRHRWVGTLAMAALMTGLWACPSPGSDKSKDKSEDDDDKKKKKKDDDDDKKKKKKDDDDDDEKAKSDDDGGNKSDDDGGDKPDEDDGGKVAANDDDAKSSHAVGDKLWVDWKGKKYPATVVQVVGGDKVKIHYDGWGSEWDEVVGPDRIKGTRDGGGADTGLGSIGAGTVTPTPSPGKEATPFIGSRSKVPTTEEWNAVTQEVTVTGSSLRNCETKMVREWLRVSCRGEPKGYGKPVSVNVTRGGSTDTFTFSNHGVTSLVTRFVPGVDIEARFVWGFREARLKVEWPRGAPEPPAKGRFDDAF